MYHIVIYSCYREIQRDFAVDINMRLVQVVWIQIETILLLLRIIFELAFELFTFSNNFLSI